MIGIIVEIDFSVKLITISTSHLSLRFKKPDKIKKK